jgi:hypothetical protein
MPAEPIDLTRNISIDATTDALVMEKAAEIMKRTNKPPSYSESVREIVREWGEGRERLAALANFLSPRSQV